MAVVLWNRFPVTHYSRMDFIPALQLDEFISNFMVAKCFFRSFSNFIFILVAQLINLYAKNENPDHSSITALSDVVLHCLQVLHRVLRF